MKKFFAQCDGLKCNKCHREIECGEPIFLDDENDGYCLECGGEDDDYDG